MNEVSGQEQQPQPSEPTKPQRNKFFKIVVIGGLLVLLSLFLVILVFYWKINSAPENIAKLDNQDEKIDIVEDNQDERLTDSELSNWEVYSDNKLNIQFSFPKGYEIYEREDQTYLKIGDGTLFFTNDKLIGDSYDGNINSMAVEVNNKLITPELYLSGDGSHGYIDSIESYIYEIEDGVYATIYNHISLVQTTCVLKELESEWVDFCADGTCVIKDDCYDFTPETISENGKMSNEEIELAKEIISTIKVIGIEE